MQNEKVIEQLKVLDNEVKLRILALLTESGAKSITDIAKQLNLNFSTAHKYLEQLEHAGFVRSKQETENRLKRMFYIQDFCIHVDPDNIASILRGQAVEHGEEAYADFSVITDYGKLERFNKFKFAKPYLDRGIPKNTIEHSFEAIQSQIYTGISLIELRNMFELAIKKQNSSISTAMSNIAGSRTQIKTFLNYISTQYPKAIDLHVNGDIFIENLGTPYLFNFSHDLSAITLFDDISGLKDYLTQLTSIIKKLADLYVPEHALDSFNYFISRYTSKLSEDKVNLLLREFVHAIEQLGIKMYIGIDMGMPKYLKLERTINFLPEDLMGYEVEAAKNAERMISIIKDAKSKNIHLVYKMWEIPSVAPRLVQDSYVTNMIPEWQTSNSVYFNDSRLDAEWKYWMRTVRVGDLQNISINIPRIARRSKTPTMFKEELFNIINEALEATKFSFELVNSLQNRYLFKKIKYIHLDDSQYSISLVGLSEACAIMTKDDASKHVRAITTLLREVNDFVKNKEIDYIRISIRECRCELISNYFFNKDAKLFKLKENNYAKSLFDEKIGCGLQKYFNGGHRISLPLAGFDLKRFLSNDGGFVKLE